MELDLKNLLKKHNLHPSGVLNIGCHYFQERALFESVGIEKYILFEPQKHAFLKARSNAVGLNCQLFNCALSDEAIVATKMYCDDISVNQGGSSSLLKPKKHLEQFPHVKFNREEIVAVYRLDDISFSRKDYSMIFIDVQGNELNVFKGGRETLKFVDCIFTEVNFTDLYENGCLIEQLDDFLLKCNFVRIETGADIGGYSDAMYIKK